MYLISSPITYLLRTLSGSRFLWDLCYPRLYITSEYVLMEAIQHADIEGVFSPSSVMYVVNY